VFKFIKWHLKTLFTVIKWHLKTLFTVIDTVLGTGWNFKKAEECEIGAFWVIWVMCTIVLAIIAAILNSWWLLILPGSVLALVVAHMLLTSVYLLMRFIWRVYQKQYKKIKEAEEKKSLIKEE
jgi:hypothetical protein